MSDKKPRIYFDHNATTPARKAVVEAMLPWFSERFGNASSIHFFGQEARRAVDEARASVARLLGCEPEEIIFTSGGTESDNLAIRGVLARASGEKEKLHVVTTSIEHPAVLRTCRSLEEGGTEVTFLPCGPSGRIEPAQVENALRPETAIVSVMTANNETGVIQPVEEISSLVRERGIVFHTDAVQGVGKIPVDVGRIGADLMSVSAHKFYGPKGIGALYVRRGVSISPVHTGGRHESGLRPGTENIPAIVGFGEACRITKERLGAEMKLVASLRKRLEDGLMSRIDDVYINGVDSRRVPNTCSVVVGCVEGEAMTLNLSMLGFALSTGSACATGENEPSHVLRAMGVGPADAQSALRISLGIGNTADEIDIFLDAFTSVVRRLRKISPVKRADR